MQSNENYQEIIWNNLRSMIKPNQTSIYINYRATAISSLRNILEYHSEILQNPTHIMVDFEKASINALEEHFLAVVSGCFFHFSQNIFRKIQSKGLTNQYMEDPEFARTMRMLPSLAFVPEHYVSDCFLILMADFPNVQWKLMNISKKPTSERDC